MSEPTSGPGSNTGHGHVWRRPDGVRARCGGPKVCSDCATDFAKYETGDASSPADPAGVWLVHCGDPYSSVGHVVPFRTEIEASRQAVDNSSKAVFVPFGKTLADAENESRP